MVGGAFRIEAEYIGTPADAPRRMRCIAEDLRDDVFVERAGKLEPWNEVRQRRAIVGNEPPEPLSAGVRITRSVGVIDSQGRRATTRDERVEVVWVMRLAARHHGEPLKALYDAYGGRIFRLGLLLLHDGELAEDLVEETFVRLWRSADHYDPARSSVRTFVFTLARRAAIELSCRRGRALPSSFAEPEQDDVAGNDAFWRLLRRLEVREALDALSPVHREVLELQFGRDLTPSDIADHLGIPLGTVQSRGLRALRAFAQARRNGVSVPRVNGHHDLAPYVLDRLSPVEHHAFERHLESCESCRAEIAELEEGAALLAGAPPAVRVPTGLRRSHIPRSRALGGCRR